MIFKKYGCWVAGLILLLSSNSAFASCERGHWVNIVSNGGEVVILEDGSVWQVSPVDAIDTMLWLPTTDIVVCDDKLINTEDKEVVDAIRVR